MAYTKVTREQIATYVNITPSETTPTYAIVGVGITDYGQDYNPQTETTKWIIHKNATTTLNSFQIQASASQQCYYGDPMYDFVNNLRRTGAVGSKVETDVLDIDLYDSTEVGGVPTYKATKYACAVVVTGYAKGENPTIDYDIYYNGDPILGKVTISDGEPTFTADVVSA